MIKHIFLFIIISFIFTDNCNSQTKDFNFIIVVDDNVNPIINSVSINLFFENSNYETLELNYFPGNLEITETNFQKINNTSLKSLQLKIKHIKICGDETKYFDYTIDDFNIEWLNEDFFILYIYNTNNKKYKKIHFPLPNKEFTYEYQYPGGSMNRVQKKLTKEQKHCKD